MGTGIFISNVISTWFMVGLIWLVHVVQYPLFAAVGADAFAGYHQRHTRRITGVVAVPMLLELGSSLALLWTRPPQIEMMLIWTGAALAVLVWMVTAALVVPHHNALSREFSTAAFNRLLRGNALRTGLWTAHGAVVALMLRDALR